MAILFRNTADLTIGGMTARLTVYFLDGRLRAELTPDDPQTATVYTGALDVTVTYNGTVRQLSANPFTKAVSAVFKAAEGQKSLMLSSAAEIVYGGTASSSLTVSWKGDGSLAPPALGISYASGLRLDHSSRIEWNVDGVPEGYLACTLGVWMYRTLRMALEADYTRSCLIDRKCMDSGLEHSISDLEKRQAVYYRIAVGLYRADGAEYAGRDDYELYLEIETPVYVCSGSDVYTLAPHDFRCSGVLRNRVVNLTWKVLPDAVETGGFRVDYTYATGNWTQLFWSACPSNSYSFSVPEGITKIAFRILSYSTRSRNEQSEYLYGPWLEIGQSNVYVGYGGSIVPASEIRVGSGTADLVLNVG